MSKSVKLHLIEFKIRFYEAFFLRLANFLTISNPYPLWQVKIYILRFLGLKIELPSFIDEGFAFLGPKRIFIGKHCSFGHNNKFWAFNKIHIGSYVQTAIGLTLVAGSHRTDDYSPLTENQDIFIEGENWIGANVTVIGGVRIGRGSIIAAGSVVTKDIPPYSIAAGVPAKVIKTRIPSKSVETPFGQYTPQIHSDEPNG